MSIKNSLLNHIIQIFSLLFVIFFTLFVFKPGLNKIQDEISSQKDSLIESLEHNSGLEIKYDSMSPLIFDSIVLNNVKINNIKGDNFVNVSKFTVKLNLFTILRSVLLKSRNSDFISSIDLRDGNVGLNFGDEWIYSLFKGGDISDPIITTKLFLKNIDGLLTWGDFNLDLSNIKGSISARDKRYYLNLKTNCTFNSDLNTPFKYIYSDISISGFLENSIVNLDSKLKLRNTSSDIGVIEDLDLGINIDSLVIYIKDLKGSQNSFIYDYPKSEMFFKVDVDKFNINDVFKPYDKELIPPQIMNSNFSGSVKGAYDLINETFIYSGKGELNTPDIVDGKPLRAQVNLIGDLSYVTFKTLNLYTHLGYLGFNGGLNLTNMFPNGRVYLRGINLGQGVLFDSNIKLDVVNNNFINAQFDYILTEGIKISNISSVIYIDDTDISFQALKEDSKQKLYISGNYNKMDKSITSSLSIEDLNLDLFKNIDILKGFDKFLNNKLSLTGDFNIRDNNISYNVKDIILEDYDNSPILSGEVRGNNSNFSLDSLDIRLDDIGFVGRIDGKKIDDTLFLKVDSLINDNKYKVDVSINPNNIKATGSYGLNFEYWFEDSKFINLSLDNFPIKYRNYDLETSLTGKLALLEDDSFLISVPTFSGEFKSDILPFNPIVNLSLDGSNKNLNISNFSITDNISTLRGGFNIDFTESGYISILGNLKGENSEEYNLNSLITPDLKDLFIDLNIKNFLLDRLGIQGLKGRSDLNVNLEKKDNKFSGDGSINAKEFFYNSSISSLGVEFKLSEELITLLNLTGKFNNNNLSIPLITYNFFTGDILGKANFSNTSSNLNLSSDIAIDLSIKPVKDIFSFDSNIIEDINGSITLLDFVVNDSTLFSNKNLRIFNNISALQIYSIDRNLKFIHSHKTGLTNLKISNPYFADLSMSGYVNDGDIDLSFKDIVLDGGFINNFLPNIVDLQSLYLYGQFNLHGPVNDPVINGLLWADTKFNLSYIPDEIRETRINLRFVDNVISLLPSSVELEGGGGISLSGEVVLRELVPESMLFELKIDKNRSIPILYPYGNIVTEVGLYTPKISYFWDNSGSIITGDAYIQNSEFYTKIINVTEDDSKSVKESSSGIELDLNVEIGANNKLYWPNKNFPILDATLKPGDKMSVKYNSVSGEFNVLGRISIINGEVDYSGKPFVLKEGEVILNLSKDQINPYLKIIGSKTVLDDNERQVEVLLTFEGGFFSDFKPTFSSNDPTKTEEDISSLVGLAFVGDSLSLLGADVVDEILTSYITTSVEEGIKDLIGVDDVKIKSGFISSLLTTTFPNIFNITNNSFDEGSESVYNLSQMLNNTSLTIGNFITDDLFVKGSISSIYENEELNLGVNLGLTLYTPYFQLGLSMEPKMSDNYIFEPELGLSIEWIYNPQ
ncbi:hypothetical protein EW093_00620 [Thiospirochaeta perfilievii]|uniref:Uncharacterized protein n=1 Tax=Thiospirochaeta perfilievii TaxID=252967 RepID=A0A5C1Q7H5_9SPIO|nr:hypothetical protein [Thiospirochaeta perfilievii]QEN03268.1 hypothetical protein EW093_00620 [Thiospirochaeta perfilievii]